MGPLATNNRQLTLIYHSETRLGKQALGYAQGSKNKLQVIDISKTSLGDTAWVSIAEGLGKPLHELFAKDLPEGPRLQKADFDTNGWLKVLNNHPALLQRPIAINGEEYLQLETPSDVLKLFGADSAGLEKNPRGMDDGIQPGSDGDTFV